MCPRLVKGSISNPWSQGLVQVEACDLSLANYSSILDCQHLGEKKFSATRMLDNLENQFQGVLEPG